MAKLELKKQTQQLRRRGHSLKEICRILNISKSTASLWCSGIVLSESQSAALAKRAQSKNYAGALLGALANRRKSEQVQKDEAEAAKNFIGTLSEREICLIGTALYWAEGSKTRKTFGVTNMDPNILLITMKWLSIQFHIKKVEYYPRLYVNILYKDEEEKLKRYWSKTLGIPLKQFRRTIIIQSKLKKKFNTAKGYNGVMHLQLRSSSKVIYRTLSQIENMRSEILKKI